MLLQSSIPPLFLITRNLHCCNLFRRKNSVVGITPPSLPLFFRKQPLPLPIYFLEKLAARKHHTKIPPATINKVPPLSISYRKSQPLISPCSNLIIKSQGLMLDDLKCGRPEMQSHKLQQSSLFHGHRRSV